MADDTTTPGAPTPGMQTSEMKVLALASLLTAIAGMFHKQLDMDAAVKLVDALAAVYIAGRSAVKAAASVAATVGAWLGAQKAVASQPRVLALPPILPPAVSPRPATPAVPPAPPQ